MVLINSENVRNIIQSAENGLKKKPLGGFTPESTKEALQKVADGVKQLADNAIGTVQKELQEYRGKSAQEMVALTSKKDAVILEKDNKIAEVTNQLFDAKQQIKAAKSVKVGKPKELSNGNIETVKVNKNGSIMTTETTKDGRKVQVSVETIDGDVRKTKYNIASGKPVNTYTNVNGEKLINYDNNGALKNTELVNVPKSKIQKAKIISDKVVENNNGIQKIRKDYSDGSFEFVEYNSMGKFETNGEKFNLKGQLTEKFETYYSNNDKIKVTYKYNPETNKTTEIISENSNGTQIRTLYDEATAQPYKQFARTKQGLKRIITADVDKYGNINRNNPSVKYIYPKNSPIKDSKLEFMSQYLSTKETLKMKDGSQVSMYINPYDNYNPSNVTIHKKGEQPQILDLKSGQEYLDSIGKVGYQQDPNYFSNNLS